MNINTRFGKLVTISEPFMKYNGKRNIKYVTCKCVVNYWILSSRIRNGWNPEKALTTPKNKNKSRQNPLV